MNEYLESMKRKKMKPIRKTKRMFNKEEKKKVTNTLIKTFVISLFTSPNQEAKL